MNSSSPKWLFMMGIVLVGISIATFATESSSVGTAFANGLTGANLTMNIAVLIVGICGSILIITQVQK